MTAPDFEPHGDLDSGRRSYDIPPAGVLVAIVARALLLSSAAASAFAAMTIVMAALVSPALSCF
jgi:hypothetical protein